MTERLKKSPKPKTKEPSSGSSQEAKEQLRATFNPSSSRRPKSPRPGRATSWFRSMPFPTATARSGAGNVLRRPLHRCSKLPGSSTSCAKKLAMTSSILTSGARNGNGLVSTAYGCHSASAGFTAHAGLGGSQWFPCICSLHLPGRTTALCPTKDTRKFLAET